MVYNGPIVQNGYVVEKNHKKPIFRHTYILIPRTSFKSWMVCEIPSSAVGG